MLTLTVLNLIKLVRSEVCTFEEYKGKERYTSSLLCTGKQFSSICASSLKKFTQLKNLEINNTSLTSLPDGIEYLQNLERLLFNNNNIIGKAKNIEKLVNLKHLEYLDLSRNNIEVLPGCLSFLTSLKSLFIRRNAIKTIPNETNFPPFLETLDISGNQIKIVSDGIFKLKNLKNLYLSFNLINTLPADIGILTELQTLEASNNYITNIPDTIGNLQDLESINLSHNRIHVIPDTFFLLNKIKKISLSSNILESLPMLVGNLNFLEMLDISYNYLTCLPFEIQSLTLLTYLDVSINLFINIPNEICSLVGLKTLKICHNKIDYVPYGITSLQKLETLNISQNQITIVPDFFFLLTNLTSLFIQNNKLTQLSPLLINLQKLESLDISNNQIAALPDNFDLPNLTKLDISHNLIRHLPFDIGLLLNLKLLKVNNNRIIEIPDEIGNLNSLQVLSMAHNQIEILPKNFYMLTNLKKLALSYNNFIRLSPLIGRLTMLKIFLIPHNKLTGLPVEIKYLKKLVQLDASYNKILTFSNEMDCLPTTLQVLDISNNELVNLPLIANLNNLTTFKLQNNKIKRLPSDIDILEQLKEFDLSYNYLTALPSRFIRLFNLLELSLNNNQFAHLPLNFSELKNLKTLQLQNNLFSDVPNSIFKLQKLNTLNLSGNLIESFVSTYNLSSNTASSPGALLSSNFYGASTSFATNNDIFSLTSLVNLYFDNNKLTEIPRDIIKLRRLQTLSVANNNIKQVPKEIVQLLNLTYLNLQANEIQYLPKSIKMMRRNVLTKLYLQENFISNNNSELGLGIFGLKKLKFTDLQIQTQYSTYITIEEVLNNMQTEKLYWNIDELKCIKLPVDISHFAIKISDKQMRKMWRVVLRFFIISAKSISEPDSESSEENTNEIDDNIRNITSSAAFIEIKNKATSLVQNILYESIDTNVSLSKKVSILLREKSTFESGGTERLTHELFKNYIKAVFSKMLEKIVEDNYDLESFELIKLAITDLCKNKLFECIDGTLEGLQYYYSIYFLSGNETADSSIVEFIRNIIASVKETTFINVTNGGGINGVHDISKWRAIFKNILGITHAFDDPYALQFLVINSEYKKGSVIYDFFKMFTVEYVCNSILDKINIHSTKINESIDLLKHIHKTDKPNEDDYNIYMNVIKSYCEYEALPGYAEIQAKKLKKIGLLKILYHLQILKKQHRS